MLKKVLAIVGFASALISAQTGYPQADEIKSLWQQPNIGQKFGLYSGYLPIAHTKKELHYVAAVSQGTPATDPVIIWLNGGPGCSSMIGYALEHGPYVFEDGNANMTENPYAWNKNATVIYLDAPAGTGFSLCGDQKECVFDDSNSADDNLEAVLTLLRDKFTALQNNPLWLGGEAYAGIYIPQLMQKLDALIQQTKKDNPQAWVPNLKGMLVGNGFTNYKFDGKAAFVTMAFYHGLIDDELFEFITENCNLTNIQVKGYGGLTKDCQKALNTFDQYTQFANPFDVFAKCYRPSKTQSRFHLYESHYRHPTVDQGHFALEQVPKNTLPCIWSQPMIDYFNNETTKQALNIQAAYLKEPWLACRFPGMDGFNYTINETGSVWLYNSLRGKGYKMLMYSGDTDSIVPTLGTQQWIHEQGWAVTEEWRPYFIPVSASTQKAAGYVEVRGDFTLATVHGAGQMAPKFKRQQTYQAVFNFINGKPL